MLPDGEMKLDENAGLQKLCITDITASSPYFCVPVRTTASADFKVRYVISGPACPILEKACSEAFEFVSATALTCFFTHMNWKEPAGMDAKLGMVIDGFSDEWGWSLMQRSHAFSKCHKITAAVIQRAVAIAQKRTVSKVFPACEGTSNMLSGPLLKQQIPVRRKAEKPTVDLEPKW